MIKSKEAWASEAIEKYGDQAASWLDCWLDNLVHSPRDFCEVVGALDIVFASDVDQFCKPDLRWRLNGIRFDQPQSYKIGDHGEVARYHAKRFIRLAINYGMSRNNLAELRQELGITEEWFTLCVALAMSHMIPLGDAKP